jgi:creatinine amidohydrolase/Fe(II)-dependent formamide hydrolase-like protein
MLAATAFSGFAQPKTTSLVDFEMMTWPEVKHALEQGKTTILIYNGGTEQRGPQNVNGGHTLMGHATVVAIAEKLGNAIAAPVLPYSVNNASAALPGTIGITAPLFSEINEQVAEQMIVNGFKSVVFMGDHGGGQRELADLARKLAEKHAAQGIKVVYCGDVYQKANDDFDKYLAANNLPVSSHAGIPDTSEMLYLGADKGWVRKDEIPNAVGRPPRKHGDPPPDPNAPRAPNNGIQGDARPSTAELGKKIFDLKVDYAVAQIHELLK